MRDLDRDMIATHMAVMEALLKVQGHEDLTADDINRLADRVEALAKYLPPAPPTTTPEPRRRLELVGPEPSKTGLERA